MKIKKVTKTVEGTGEITKEYAENTFKELLAFQGYGFCKAHATSYSVYSAVQMWLQEHYFLEYMCSLLNHIDRAKEKKGVGVLNERVEYCINHSITIHYPDVTKSSDKWKISGGSLIAPLKNIKGFSDREVNTIVSNRPYKDLKDFLDKTKFNKNRFEQLLFANAFSEWGTVDYLYNWYYNHYFEKEKKEKKAKKNDTVELFSFDVEEPSSSSEEVIRNFSKNELEDLCLDLNGFVVIENLQNKYADFFKRGMEAVAEFKRNEAYNTPRRRIYKLADALNDEVKEDGYKNKWILVKIVKEDRGIPGKWGKPFDKIVISDGYTKATMMNGYFPSCIKKGNVVVLPVSINDKGKIFIDKGKCDKLDIVVLEEA